VILVQQGGLVRTLADIEGHSLILHRNPRSCLALLWLDTRLIQQGHPTADRFAGKISLEVKLSKVVLSLFLNQAGACVVTRKGVDTMAELNPQLAEQLVIIAESPDLVPALFSFRADYTPDFKQKIITGLKELKTSPEGRQVLTIFQSDDIDEQPASCLESSLALIAIHERMMNRGAQP
jgi:phosphonate transport system substrate-binding protein